MFGKFRRVGRMNLRLSFFAAPNATTPLGNTAKLLTIF
jgi:hypothetical protein